MTAKSITNVGFLSEFMRRHKTERPFCWILGSGASLQSGVPTGGELVKRWLGEMHELEDGGQHPIEEWATEDSLGITGFTYAEAARFYPWIYERRYRDYKDLGYAFLEQIMEAAEPSYGYSVLAQIMATFQHRVAITTNFDNLIADALSIYTKVFPLVCGHESLTGYLRPNMRRPMVAKIHRDLLLHPLNDPSEISRLSGEWGTALTAIFENYTPIVIGYGGNDGSLMTFLKNLNPIVGGMFWCHRNPVDPIVHEVVEHHKGSLVPIAGFDELMLQLWEKLGLTSPLPELQKVYEQRTRDYQNQFESLQAALKKPAESAAAEEALKPVRGAAEAAVQRLTKEKSSWSWELKAKAEPDPEKREEIYRAGLQDFPGSAELTGNLANFMRTVRRNYDEAERLYRRALALDPNHAIITGNFALFMHYVRKNHDEAERLYRRALELDPRDVTNIDNLATFVTNIRGNHDEAERLYRRALKVDPNHASSTGNFANFMRNVRNNHDDAERLYRRALELDPKNANNTVNFAQFLVARDRVVEARDFANRALELIGDALSGQAGSEIALLLWLLDRGVGRDGMPMLHRLKSLLSAGFERSTWSFDAVLAVTVPRLPENERALARKLADAILDETKVAALDDEQLWNAA